jgi:AcrR family transcriptional regulator
MIRSDDAPRSRKEQRQRTESAILGAARDSFAEHGFERTTIRGIARDAGVDPGLVMQYFGSKDALFAAAARSTVDTEELVAASLDQLPRMALGHVFAGFEDPARRASSAALLRSCLTHPTAQALVRDEVMRAAQASVARTIGGEDAALRAAVLNACTLGLAIARYLLEDPVLTQASHEDLGRVMEPALRAVVDPEGEDACASRRSA